MANKLKNLQVTSVDLVDAGANQDAHIRLFKRAPAPVDGITPEEESLFRKFARWIRKGGTDGGQEGSQEPPGGPQPEDPEGNPADPETGAGEPGEGVGKGMKLFSETVSRELMERVTGEVFDYCYALSDSLSSILCDKDLNEDSRRTMMGQSLKEFGEAVGAAVPVWARGESAKTAADAGKQAGLQKSQAQQAALKSLLEKRGLLDAPETHVGEADKEVDTMKIDKSRMTPEEVAVLEGFEKNYGIQEPEEAPQPENTPDGVEKNAPEGAGTESMHPEVQKALSDMRAAYDAQTKQVEALQKSLEMERLAQVAKKYEPLGKKADELAAKMYDLKKAGGTVYDDYVALLDENLAMLGKSKLFGEIGSNRQGSAGIEESIGIKAADIAKNAAGGMDSADAVIKAFEENPDLAAQYEQEYARR